MDAVATPATLAVVCVCCWYDDVDNAVYAFTLALTKLPFPRVTLCACEFTVCEWPSLESPVVAAVIL